MTRINVPVVGPEDFAKLETKDLCSENEKPENDNQVHNSILGPPDRKIYK